MLIRITACAKGVGGGSNQSTTRLASRKPVHTIVSSVLGLSFTRHTWHFFRDCVPCELSILSKSYPVQFLGFRELSQFQIHSFLFRGGEGGKKKKETLLTVGSCSLCTTRFFLKFEVQIRKTHVEINSGLTHRNVQFCRPKITHTKQSSLLGNYSIRQGVNQRSVWPCICLLLSQSKRYAV